MKNKCIIIDDKIVTNDVSFIKFDNNLWVIKYKNSKKFYYYSEEKVRVIDNPNKVLNYIKEISLISGMDLKNNKGENILYSQLEKVEVKDLDNALANYLGISKNIIRQDNLNVLIFPFGCNASQYKAVDNAIHGKISVIEGPPGTGKTQTILNIIANIIIRGMNVQVVSNNNDAIKNVQEKLEKYNLDFITALLGRKTNKDSFFENQSVSIPNLEDYKNVDNLLIERELEEKRNIVRKVYNVRNDIAILNQKKDELALEYRYFIEYAKSQNYDLLKVNFSNLDNLKRVFNEMISIENLSFWRIFKFVFCYKVGNIRLYKKDFNLVLNSIKNEIYLNDIKFIDLEIQKKQKFLDDNKETEEDYIDLSMVYFKNYLCKKYSNGRKIYSAKEMWKNSRKFLDEYPVILSTTYSSKSSINDVIRFDYTIMDESSQVDVVTGTLALSSAKYAVIIGDEKQLPNVVKPEVRVETDKIFNKYNLDKEYSYSLNSFLSSTKHIVSGIRVTLLREHYRCHPKIINFCNKEFYNNELVIMTIDNGERDVIKVIKTNKGDHARGKTNQRQIDIMKDIVPSIKSKDYAIIAPYNDQVDLVRDNIPEVDTSTVHKVQGREKDVIIISTVDDKIGEFVGDPNLLNVAISRAKQQLIFIVTGNDISNKVVKDFIDYVDYNNMEIVDSKITFVFDILYKQYELERLDFFKKNNRILNFDSENVIYYLLDKVVKDYDSLDFLFYQPLNELIKDKSLLTDDEKRYVLHHNTHVDFRIYNKNSKKTVLVVEVDGYKYHKKGTKQYERDLMKNSILDKYNIPYIRLVTNGSEEEEKIRNKLNEFLK